MATQSQPLTRKKTTVHVADIVRHGEKLVVPETMTYAAAIDILDRKRTEEETVVGVRENVIAFPWEGALAFRKALEEMFGSSLMTDIPGFFGNQPPKMIAVDTGVDTKEMVPWGRFPFPLDKDGYLQTAWNEVDGRIVFSVVGELKKKWLPNVQALMKLTEKYVAEQSIYRGKALRIDFSVNVPEPRFVDLRGIDVAEMVYTRELTQLIESNVFTPIRHAAECRKAGIPLKRGALLAGPYGTGKSLLARAVAKTGTDHGWTFIYIADASQLPAAIRFANMYQPAIIFAEDVDRHVTGERTEQMDTILNTLDGIDSKHTELMVILTTNHLDQINRAMLRPGRLDVILNITAPDAEAVQRLVTMYVRGRLEEGTDLAKAGELLAGYTPAIIREVVERAKLTGIARTGDANAALTGEDIVVSAMTMVQQQNLLKAPEKKAESWSAGLVQAIAESTKETLHGNGVGTMIRQVQEIHDSTC